VVLGHCCVLVPGQPQSAFGLQYAIVQYIVQGASHSQLRPVPRDFHQVHSRSPSLQIKYAQGARRQVRSTCPAASRPARDAPRPRSLPQHARAPHTSIRTPPCPCTQTHMLPYIARGSDPHTPSAVSHAHCIAQRVVPPHIAHTLCLTPTSARTYQPSAQPPLPCTHCLLLRFAGRAVDYTIDGSTEPRPSQRHRGSAGNLQTSLLPSDHDDGDGYGDV